MEAEKKIIIANEFRLNDAEGKTKISISAGDNGQSAIRFYNDKGQEKIEISLDDQGTHIHLSGLDRQETYLFQKNSGATGLVLTDAAGERRLEVTVGPDSAPQVRVFPANGEAREL